MTRQEQLPSFPNLMHAHAAPFLCCMQIGRGALPCMYGAHKTFSNKTKRTIAGSERLLKTTHLELDGKLFVNT
jgi:hypothetical protein